MVTSRPRAGRLGCDCECEVAKELCKTNNIPETRRTSPEMYSIAFVLAEMELVDTKYGGLC